MGILKIEVFVFIFVPVLAPAITWAPFRRLFTIIFPKFVFFAKLKKLVVITWSTVITYELAVSGYSLTLDEDDLDASQELPRTMNK